MTMFNDKLSVKRLYKYIPSGFVRDMLDGAILFRNFTYFRQTEGKTRGDYLEAHHRDNPDNDKSLQILSTGRRIVANCSFLNHTNTDVIYMFCMSLLHVESLYSEFETDSCIEITDVEEFFRRIRVVVQRRVSIHEKGLLCGAVRYYRPNTPTTEDIEDTTILPFLKDEIYSHQKEYRFVFGTRRAFKLEKKIVLNNGYDFHSEAMKGMAKDCMIKIGSIKDIAKTHHIA